jgi:hypothetical protein
MLKYKARAFNLRDNFPDILKGLHLQEEMVGEVDEPMEAPKCDVAGRHDRRKKVVSTDLKGPDEGPVRWPKKVAEEHSPPPKDPAEGVTDDDSAGVREQHKPLDKPAEVVEADLGTATNDVSQPTPKANDSAGEIIEAEVVDTDAFGDLLADYDDAGGVVFQEWAAEALCRDEDEVDSPEKFTPEMISRLNRHLESEGV